MSKVYKFGLYGRWNSYPIPSHHNVIYFGQLIPQQKIWFELLRQAKVLWFPGQPSSMYVLTCTRTWSLLVASCNSRSVTGESFSHCLGLLHLNTTHHHTMANLDMSSFVVHCILIIYLACQPEHNKVPSLELSEALICFFYSLSLSLFFAVSAH